MSPTAINPIENEDLMVVLIPRRLTEWCAGERQSYGSGYRHLAALCKESLSNDLTFEKVFRDNFE